MNTKHILLFSLIVLSFNAAFAPIADRNGRIFISKDQGVNWEPADNGFPVDDQVNALVFKDGIVFAGTNEHGVLISSDKMQSWYSVVKGLPKKAAIISLTVHRNILFAGTRSGGVFSSYDDGETWASCNVGLYGLSPSLKFTSQPYLSIRALHSTGPVIFAGTDDGVYSSSDNGKTWTPQLSGLQINDFSSYRGQVFAATNKGVLVLEQSGKSWKSIFNTIAVSRMDVQEGKIYILGFDGVALQSDIPTYIWLKTALFVPFESTFRLTPASVKFFKASWKNSLRNAQINSTCNGLPETLVFTELLNTPFGVIAAAKQSGC